MLPRAAARTERRGLSVLSHRPGYALADSRTQYMYMTCTRHPQLRCFHSYLLTYLHPRTTDPQSTCTHMDMDA